MYNASSKLGTHLAHRTIGALDNVLKTLRSVLPTEEKRASKRGSVDMIHGALDGVRFRSQVRQVTDHTRPTCEARVNTPNRLSPQASHVIPVQVALVALF